MPSLLWRWKLCSSNQFAIDIDGFLSLWVCKSLLRFGPTYDPCHHSWCALRSSIKILDGLGFKLSTNVARYLGCREYILYNVKEGSSGTKRVVLIKKYAYVKMTVVSMPQFWHMYVTASGFFAVGVKQSKDRCVGGSLLFLH
jgi:hypothetical protein